MSERVPPVRRSIGLSGVIWFIIAVGAMIAIGAAFSAGRYALTVVAAAFMVAAAVLGFRARRMR